MAITFSWIILIALLTLIVLQAALVFRYFGFMVGSPRGSQQPEKEPDTPRTAVVLCLRGDDPSLSSCLGSLIAQDYPNFEIHLVLDSRQDPALKTVERFLLANDGCNVKTKTIFLIENSDPSTIVDSCSLKNQALIAAISNAEQTIEVFALVDADGVVEQNWLSNLIAPFSDQQIGVATGSRWFAPSKRNPGSLVRQTWNAAALPQMHFYNIPWGGALAIRRSVIDSCDLLTHWSRGFCEDTMLPRILGENGFQIAHAPDVIVESEESITLTAAMNWIARQLLTVRLHHRSWPLVLGHALFSGVCLVGAVGSITLCFVNQHYFHGVRLLLVLLVFLIANVVLLQVIQVASRRGTLKAAFKKRDDKSSNTTKMASRGPGFLGAMLTQLLYPLIAIKAALMRKVEWRGINYLIGPGKKISMDGYRPYQEDPLNSDTSL